MRQIIILDRVGWPSDDAYNVAFWLTVPAARRPFYADAAFVSRVIGSEAPDATELEALRTGAVVERVRTIYMRTGTTAAQRAARLIAVWQGLQGEIDARNDWDRYGTFWDGTAWTTRGVA